VLGIATFNRVFARDLKMGNPFFEHPILNSPYDCPQAIFKSLAGEVSGIIDGSG
jgi:hypothetical protein